ncbi:eukaryotic translation initiation factor 4B-like isoform X2 [Glandiceps talaboti]
MAASGKKKGKLKGKTLNLNEFLSNDSGGGGSPAPSYTYKPVNSWADETDDIDDGGGGSSAWPDSDVYTKPAVDRSRLPTAPRSSRPIDIDQTRLPSGPPYTAFLGNLPYDCEKDDIFQFFRNLKVTEVRLPRDGGGEEGRLKGFGYAEFEDINSLLEGLALNNEMLKNRRLRVDIAGQSQEKGDNMGRDQGPDRTEGDWRRPADDVPPPVSSREDRYRDIREYGGGGYDRYDRYGSDDRDRYDSHRNQDRYGGRSRGGYNDYGYDRYDRYNDRDRYNSYGDYGGRNRSGYNDYGYDRNDRDRGSYRDRYQDNRGYGDRGGYGRDDRSYGDRSYGSDRGYSDRNRGYGDRDRSYGDRDRGYGDRDRGYGDRYGGGGGGGFDDRRSDGGRRSFGSGYRGDDRQYRDEGSGGYNRDRGGYERKDRYERDSDRDRYGDREQSASEQDAPRERRRLQLQPRTQPVETTSRPSAPPPSKAAGSSIFGGAKPVDTASREREIEERIQKEKQQLEEERMQSDREKQDGRKDSWREGRQRRDSDRSNDGRDNAPRTRHGSSGSGSGRGGPRPVMHTRRDSERSDDSVFKEEKEQDPTSPRQVEEPKKNVVPAPPPKENPWTRRSHSSEPKSPTSGDRDSRPSSESSQNTPPREQTHSSSKKDYVDAPPPKENIWAKRSATKTSPGDEPVNDHHGDGRKPDNKNYRDYNKDRRKDDSRQEPWGRDKGSQGQSSKDRRPQEPREMPKYEEPAPPTWGTKSKFALLDDEGEEDGNVSD